MTVLSTLYGAVLLSSMLLPPLLIRVLGCKWTIVVSMSCYVTFSLGNFYASWYGHRGLPRGRQAATDTGAQPWGLPLLLLNELGLCQDSAGALSLLLVPLPGLTFPGASVGTPLGARELLLPQ